MEFVAVVAVALVAVAVAVVAVAVAVENFISNRQWDIFVVSVAPVRVKFKVTPHMVRLPSAAALRKPHVSVSLKDLARVASLISVSYVKHMGCRFQIHLLIFLR